MNQPFFGLLGLFLMTLVLWSCSDDEQDDKDNGHLSKEEFLVFEHQYHRNDPQENATFSLFNENELDVKLYEISGIVSSRKNPSLVYMHEDSGNRNVVFVYDTLGVFKGEIVLFGVSNRDWEDIAIGPGPEEGEIYVYVADFGDNRSVREFVRIHFFPEIDLSAELQKDTPFKIILEDFETIEYQYPDGPRDAETLMIDPFTKDLIVVTKREVNVHVYQLPFPQRTSGMAEVHFRGRLPFRTIVGGDISPNGQEMLIKDYGTVYHWEVEENDPIKTLFKQTPSTVAYVPEVQGEAVGWTYRGDGYFTITEIDKLDADLILYHYKR